MGIFEDANEAAVESVAKSLQWVTHPAPVASSVSRIGLFSPTSAAAGVAVLRRPKTMVAIPLREEPSLYSSRVQVVAVGDATTTYRATLNGTDIDFTPGGVHTAADALDGLRDAINAFGAPISTILVATTRDTDGDGVVDELLVQRLPIGIGYDASEHTTLVSVPAGPGGLSADEDLSTSAVQIWGLMGGTNAPPQWLRARSGTFSGIDRKGVFERLDTAGLDRLYLELTASSAPSGGGTVGKVIASLGVGVV